MSLALNLIDLLSLLPILTWISPTNSSSVHIRIIIVNLLSSCTFIISIWVVQLLSDSLHSPSIDTLTSWIFYSSFWHECQTVQHAVSKFLLEWIASFCWFPRWQYPTKSSLLHSRQKPKMKQMCKINNLKWLYFSNCILSLLIRFYHLQCILFDMKILVKIFMKP